MQCNIQRKGRVARLTTGLITLAAGVVLLALAGMGTLVGWWWWLIAAAALAGGAFQVFEAYAGWCVVRAMGFKTPM